MTQQQDQDVAHLTAAVEQTRQDLAATLDTLQARLQPRQVMHDAGEAVLDRAGATTTQAADAISQAVHDFGAQVQTYLHDTPLVATVLGAVATWLTILGQRAHHAGQAAADTAQTTLGQARDQGAQLAAQAQATTATIAAQGGQTAAQAQQQAEHALKRIEHTLRDNPWLVGALTVATGLIIGLTLPKSNQERELYGHARTALSQQMQNLSRDVLGALLGMQGALHTPPAPTADPPAPPPAME